MSLVPLTTRPSQQNSDSLQRRNGRLDLAGRVVARVRTCCGRNSTSRNRRRRLSQKCVKKLQLQKIIPPRLVHTHAHTQKTSQKLAIIVQKNQTKKIENGKQKTRRRSTYKKTPYNNETHYGTLPPPPPPPRVGKQNDPERAGQS